MAIKSSIRSLTYFQQLVTGALANEQRLNDPSAAIIISAMTQLRRFANNGADVRRCFGLDGRIPS
jgi:hypothetical protein